MSAVIFDENQVNVLTLWNECSAAARKRASCTTRRGLLARWHDVVCLCDMQCCQV